MDEYKQQKLETYNQEPVYYCVDCLSLAISTIDDDDFCNSCGSFNIAVTTIQEWEKLYENKYKHKFIQK